MTGPTTTKQYSLKPHPQFGFLQIHPTPNPDEITRFYTEEFYSGDYKRFNDSSLEVQMEDLDFYHAHYQDMCDSFPEVLGRSLQGLEVLDIGCGWGQALLYFQKKGMNVYGFDPAPEAVEYVKKQKVNALVAGMNKMDVFKGKRFDVVTLLNVLEHLADPVAILKEIRSSVLKKGGLVAIEVPNEFNAFQTAANDLYNLQEWWVAPPGHLNYFNPSTLANLLEGTGFQVKLKEASFPLEMFLLYGDQYVGNPKLGQQCHKKRVAFEMNLRKMGKGPVLRQFYRTLADQNLGRQVFVIGQSQN